MTEAWAEFEPKFPLTAREMEVLSEIHASKSIREIGRTLKISDNTVKNHVRNIIEKLRLFTGGRDA